MRPEMKIHFLNWPAIKNSGHPGSRSYTMLSSILPQYMEYQAKQDFFFNLFKGHFFQLQLHFKKLFKIWLMMPSAMHKARKTCGGPHVTREMLFWDWWSTQICLTIEFKFLKVDSMRQVFKNMFVKEIFVN